MVNSSRIAVALAVLLPASAAVAAERPAARSAHDGSTVAVASRDLLDAATMHAPVPIQGTSPGTAATLPGQLETSIPGTQMPFYLINVGLLDPQHSPDAGCVSVDEPTCDAPR